MSLRSIMIPRRRGLTLVELLMVISILALLMVVAVPLIRPAFQDRYLREAARQVNTFCLAAQARAAETGRPVGVWIERLDATDLGSRQAMRLYIAEVGPGFTGALLGSRVRVLPNSGGALVFSTASDAAVLQSLVAPGYLFTIKFDHKGFDYVGERNGTSFGIRLPLVPPAVELPPAISDPNGLPYEITCVPRRSAAGPLTLPGDSVIDLSLSGMGSAGWQFDSGTVPPLVTSPVVIMFAPSGRVDRVYYAGQPVRPLGPIHLLIGRRAHVVNPVTTHASRPMITNLADPTCLWVTISERTGATITSDCAGTSAFDPLPADPTPPPPYVPSARIRAARDLARNSAQKGGR